MTALELSLSRPIPSYREVGMSKRAFLELTMDEDRNRLALAGILEEYDDFFTEEDRTDSLLGPYVEKDITPSDYCWYDRTNLIILTQRSKDLLGGEVDIQTVQFATALVTAYFTDSMTNIEHEVELIEDMKYGLKDTGKEIRRLSVENAEVETQEELAELYKFVDIYNEVVEQSMITIESERKRLRRAIQALSFISGLFY